MRILDRHIALHLAGTYALTSTLLLGLFGFLDLTEQLGDVGDGHYGVAEATRFTIYMLPRRLIELTPFAAMLACVLGLGALADGRELVVMRAAGVSPVRICGSTLKAAGVLLIAIVALELYAAPQLQKSAHRMRANAIAGGAAHTSSELWARWSNGVVHIGALRHGRIPAEIEIYRYDDDQSLQHYIHAERANILGTQRWRLQNVVRKQFGPEGGPHSQRLAALDWTPALSPAQLGILDNPPHSLSPVELYQYVQHLQRQGQNAERFHMALWEKLALPVLTTAMILLAVPMAFANPRGSNTGVRLLVGGGLGLGVYLVNQTMTNLGLLFDLSPAAITLAPSLIILLIALYWLRRVA